MSETKSTAEEQTDAKETVLIAARIPREHFEELQQKAVAADRAFSAEVRRALRFYLETAA